MYSTWKDVLLTKTLCLIQSGPLIPIFKKFKALNIFLSFQLVFKQNGISRAVGVERVQMHLPLILNKCPSLTNAGKEHKMHYTWNIVVITYIYITAQQLLSKCEHSLSLRRLWRVSSMKWIAASHCCLSDIDRSSKALCWITLWQYETQTVHLSIYSIKCSLSLVFCY